MVKAIHNTPSITPMLSSLILPEYGLNVKKNPNSLAARAAFQRVLLFLRTTDFQ